MSIQTEIDRITANIAESYSVASDKGATLPETTNSDNLPDTLRTIPTGGGIAVSGATVGQTIKIAEVDGEGKPTAWEAVDFPIYQGVPFSHVKTKLIIDTVIEKDENGEYPTNVEITQRDDGTPLSLKAFLLQTDVGSQYSYSNINFNDDTWLYGFPAPHKQRQETYAYILDGDGRVVFLGDRLAYSANHFNNGQREMKSYESIEKIIIPARNQNIAEGSFIRIWELSEV